MRKEKMGTDQHNCVSSVHVAAKFVISGKESALMNIIVYRVYIAEDFPLVSLDEVKERIATDQYSISSVHTLSTIFPIE